MNYLTFRWGLLLSGKRSAQSHDTTKFEIKDDNSQISHTCIRKHTRTCTDTHMSLGGSQQNVPWGKGSPALTCGHQRSAGGWGRVSHAELTLPTLPHSQGHEEVMCPQRAYRCRALGSPGCLLSRFVFLEQLFSPAHYASTLKTCSFSQFLLSPSFTERHSFSLLIDT